MNRTKRKELQMINEQMWRDYEEGDPDVFGAVLLSIDWILKEEEEAYAKLPKCKKEGDVGAASKASIAFLRGALELLNEQIYGQSIESDECFAKVWMNIRCAITAFDDQRPVYRTHPMI